MANSINNDWRKVASSIYKKPTDSKIFGSVEIDITDLEKYIFSKRKEGLKVTYTHIFTLAVARALKQEVPELNCYIKRGNAIQRKSIDATVSVILKGSQMSSVRVSNADTLTLSELIQAMGDEITRSRNGSENKTMKMKGVLASIPWPFRSWVFNLIRKITIGWGVSIPSLGLSSDTFGSFVISNIGSIGLDMGYPALFPTSNVAFVLIMGGIKEKPWVVDNQIVPRKIISLGAALDHRVVDASHGGLLFKFIKSIVAHPEVLETKPNS
ncbi:MAG: 2-oxo acid dehydrogenase subunit E2 [Tenuifilaceae bacterium]